MKPKLPKLIGKISSQPYSQLGSKFSVLFGNKLRIQLEVQFGDQLCTYIRSSLYTRFNKEQ